jgi:hypothetical protein
LAPFATHGSKNGSKNGSNMFWPFTAARLSVEQFLQRCRWVLLHVGEHMALDVEGDRYRRVPKHLGHHIRIDVSCQQQGCRGMSEIMSSSRPHVIVVGGGAIG